MKMNRRQFLGTTATAGAGITYGLSQFSPAFGAQTTAGSTAKPALLGGDPVRKGGFPSWPVVEQNDEQGLLEVMRSRKWSRSYGGAVSNKFEETYANLMGSK